MSTLRDRIETRLAAMGRWLFTHPWLGLGIVLVLTAAAVSQVPKIGFDVSNESFFRENDPSLRQYEAFKEQFGREEFLIIGLTPKTVFDTAFLEKLKSFHQELRESVPYVDDITSLANVRDTRGEGDQLIVEDLLERVPQTDEEMAAFKARVLGSELYPNYLISPDGEFTVIIIETLAFSPGADSGDLLAKFDAAAPSAGPTEQVNPPLTPEENAELVAAAEAVAAKYDGPDFPVFVTGSPALDVFFTDAMQRDMGVFSMLAVGFIGVLLLILFRRVSGVVMPLLVVVLSLMSTIGLMAASGTPFTLPTNILPSFVLAIGVGSAVHLLAVFYQRFQQTGDKGSAIEYALGHSGMPIAMTSLTTAAGLFSFSTSEMAPIGHLGIFAGIGVLIAMLYTTIMIPALLALWPLRQHPRFARALSGGGFDRMLIGIADLATGRPWPVILISAVLIGLSLAGLTQLRLSMHFLEWIPPEMTIRRNIERVDHELGGSSNLEVIVQGAQENTLYEPAVLKGMDTLARYAEDYRHPTLGKLVHKTASVVDVVKETNRALNANRRDFYTLPDNRGLIAQELLLFENSGSDDLETLVDTQFSKARLSLIVPWGDSATYVDFVNDVIDQTKALEQNGSSVIVTGSMRLWTEMIYNMNYSMVRSYLIAGVVITLMMMLLISSVRIGVISMVVNFAPIVITMGLVMGFNDIPLDAFTLLIGSIALGLAVDDTIHFFHHFRRYYGQSGDPRQAVRETLLTAGRAMLFTTIVLVLGFWLFMFATLNNVFNFGLLTGVALIFALLSDFFLAPAILTVVTRSAYGRSVAQRWGQRVEA